MPAMHTSRVHILFLVSLASASFLLLGCGSAEIKDAGPEDMSYEAHEKAAAKHKHEAERQNATADEYEGETGAGAGNRAVYRSSAREHAAHAAAHKKAAEALFARHESACEGVSKEAMSACPLVRHRVSSVDDIEGGVRLRFSPEGVSGAADLQKVATCHAAHGAFHGREGMPGCPFYIRGLTVKVLDVAGAPVMDLTTDQPGELEELRARAHALVKGR